MLSNAAIRRNVRAFILMYYIYNNNLTLAFDCNNGEANTLLFVVDDPKSLFDLKLGLNRSKRSIVLKSISVTN